MKNILLFRIGQLGDTLIIVPSLHAIRETFPDAEICYFHDQHIGKHYVVSKDVLKNSGLVESFIDYPVGHTLFEKLKAAVRLAGIWFTLRKMSFDLVIRFEPERRNSRQLRRDDLFFHSLGVAKSISVAALRKPLPEPPFHEEQEHESDFYLRALSEEGIGNFISYGGDPSLGLTVADELEWRTQFADKIIATQVQIAVGVGSKMPAKQWPLSYYRQVLSELVQSHNIQPVFFGGAEDKEASEMLIREVGSGLNACGDLSIRGSASLMERCRFYLGNDTGTMHLAVAAGIPCVGVFSARDVPGKWYPYGKGHVVHRLSVDCEGCMLTECVAQKKKCLTGIEPAEVTQSCLRVLERDRS